MGGGSGYVHPGRGWTLGDLRHAAAEELGIVAEQGADFKLVDGTGRMLVGDVSTLGSLGLKDDGIVTVVQHFPQQDFETALPSDFHCWDHKNSHGEYVCRRGRCDICASKFFSGLCCRYNWIP